MADVEEFHVDSTYKTNRSGHELFSVITSLNGIGFPIAYFLLKMNATGGSTDCNGQYDPINHSTPPAGHPATIDNNQSITTINNTVLHMFILPKTHKRQDDRSWLLDSLVNCKKKG